MDIITNIILEKHYRKLKIE